ncbi:hypothetical protein [Plasmodium yoelii yoelii]|uniref:Uncharacterized protein n=1 Tax=Plasmodium yoelii yoelii TaxID=73239 RepID=Q7RPV7_PLAYO|nr:hypothetical protein [Plasmodium yoelii yoelii]
MTTYFTRKLAQLGMNKAGINVCINLINAI